jgi:hypothetical protein
LVKQIGQGGVNPVTPGWRQTHPANPLVITVFTAFNQAAGRQPTNPVSHCAA